jgi:hypothetical protein
MFHEPLLFAWARAKQLDDKLARETIIGPPTREQAENLQVLALRGLVDHYSAVKRALGENISRVDHLPEPRLQLSNSVRPVKKCMIYKFPSMR